MAITNCEIEFYTRVPNTLNGIKKEVSDLREQVAELTKAVSALTEVLKNKPTDGTTKVGG